MKPREIVSMIVAYESEIAELWITEPLKEARKVKIEKLIKKQVGLIEEFEKDVLTDFLEFFLTEGYCDTDIYPKQSIAIDQYLIFKKK